LPSGDEKVISGYPHISRAFLGVLENVYFRKSAGNAPVITLEKLIFGKKVVKKGVRMG